MKKLPFLFLAICLVFGACSNDESTQEEDAAKLQSIYNDIILYSKINTEPCNNPEEWGFTKLFASDCPSGDFILYSKKIDFKTLQKKIAKYRKQREIFLLKWGLLGLENDICSAETVPTGVKCVDNKPQLSFVSPLYNKK